MAEANANVIRVFLSTGSRNDSHALLELLERADNIGLVSKFLQEYDLKAKTTESAEQLLRSGIKEQDTALALDKLRAKLPCLALFGNDDYRLAEAHGLDVVDLECCLEFRGTAECDSDVELDMNYTDDEGWADIHKELGRDPSQTLEQFMTEHAECIEISFVDSTDWDGNTTFYRLYGDIYVIKN